mgnify:CR=1 FL=1
MRGQKASFEELAGYCGFDSLPEGLSVFYEAYPGSSEPYFIDRGFLAEVFSRFSLPQKERDLILNGVSAVEKDEKLLYFSQFLVWDMCSARNRCDVDNYQSLTPACLPEYGTLYSFLLLLACVRPAMELLRKRGVPEEAYRDIPYQPMKRQLEKLVRTGEQTVGDFPWDMNFYTCAIYLFDRFLFIPCPFGEDFTMYRNQNSRKVSALWRAGETFRRDGQLDGVNNVFDKTGKFASRWEESEETITANRVNPVGFVEKEPVTLLKKDWAPVLQKGDILLAVHVPSGPGYTPERLKNSMELALAFYDRYFPELPVRGFWSESWLYDPRLSLILDPQKSNIVRVQRQFYLYPIPEGDGMLRYEVFGGWKADPEKVPLITSLQKAAAAYMKSGRRFHTTSMIVLREDVAKMPEMPYITPEDLTRFAGIADSHLKAEE